MFRRERTMPPVMFPAALGSLVLGFALAAPAGAAVILDYELGQAGPQTQDAVNTAAGGNLTNAGGFGTFNLSAGNGYMTAPVLQVNPGSSSTAASSTEAFSENAYFSFTLTVGSAVTDL